MKPGQAERRPAPEDPSPRDAPVIRLEAFLPYRLSVLANRASRALARRYRERFDLTIPEWRVMAVLGWKEELSAGEIAERTAMDKVKVSRAIAALERRGLLARRRDPRDRRVSRHRLTPAGRAVCGQVARLAGRFEDRLLEVLSEEERELLFALLDRLEARLGVLAAEGQGPERRP